MIKYFRFSWHEIMFEISYTNLMMLMATIPDYSSKKDRDEYYNDIESEADFMKFFNSN